MKLGRQWKAGLLLGALLVVSAGVMFNSWVLTGRKLTIETSVMGDILLVFAQDRDRMPTGFDELLELGYLARSKHGEIVTGPVSLNRTGKDQFSAGEMTFQHFDKMRIVAIEPDERVDRLFIVDGHDAAKQAAERSMRSIRFLLKRIREAKSP